MRYLPNGTWMQKADAYTIQDLGVPSVVLMEHAAESVICVLKRENIDSSKTLIVCGSGNNGGDGFAIARLLFHRGDNVTVAFVGNEASMSEECRLQYQIVKNMGIPIVTNIPKEEYSFIIDAVFGVGLSRKISGDYAEVIKCMNRMTGVKLAVDVPSGVCAATGNVLGIAFRADYTVTFQCEKIGCTLFPGRNYAGKVFIADIGIDTSIFKEEKEILYTLNWKDLKKKLPKRSPNTHKGSYGKVLMITGGKGMAGAAYLSAKAAYACGAGLVQIYTDEANRTVLQELLPEAIISVYSDYEEASLRKLLNWASVVCIGCGLGQNEVSAQMLEGTLKNCKVPCVIDADGLNLLSQKLDLLKECTCKVILTPHMKEMSLLLKRSVSEITKKRVELLEQFVEKYPVTCALKDARTLVAEKERAIFLNTAGNHAMAKAGSGDVLAGTITGMLAGHLDAYEAAVTGVLLHACGGDEAKRRLGSYSVLARDLIEGIQKCLKKVEDM